ncbi:MAG: type II toxin-antitoxin system Phd/YefM family antitoxin [Mucilaginibacter sp.]
MEVLNFTEFRQNLAKNLDKVNNDAEIVIISRSKGKNVVLMDLEEYNAITETLHITKSEANRKRLQAAIDEMNSGAYHTHKLAED